MPCLRLITLAAVLAIAASAPAGAAVVHDVATVNKVQVDRFTWDDSHGLTRSVSIKQEGGGNPGHGGYAVQMTYQYLHGGTPRTVVVSPVGKNEGFGYFVSHERDRTFTDGDDGTIAGKIFGVDDSPLGLGFAAPTTVLSSGGDPGWGGIRADTTYHHYGTIKPIPKDADGDDVRPSPTNAGAYQNYPLPVSITWSFQSGTDYPRISTSVDLSQVGPDRINFDVRGPYGVMNFNPSGAVIDTAMWGDRYHFINTTTPIERASPWTWNELNSGARYGALISGAYEMGMFEPQPFTRTALADGYSDGRGATSDTYHNGHGCPGSNELLPCEWEWPYQSVQYSLPSDPTGTTNYPKMAWGSSPYYGTGKSLTQVYDSSSTTEAFKGDPASLDYEVCLVLGRTAGPGLTRLAARKTKTYNCAAALH
jgi:hypothetical protein